MYFLRCGYADRCDHHRIGKEFLALKPDTPKIFYIWGHAYEFDIHGDWERFEEFCRMISGHGDIFYGTNKEVLLYNEKNEN